MSLRIKSLQANKSQFKEVIFQQSFNAILAERTKESTKKDSRNGLGKSTLIALIHFCLGSRTNNKLRVYLKDWEFTLRLTIAGKEIAASRGFEAASLVFIEGNTSDLPITPKPYGDRLSFSAKEWNLVLGKLTFGLPVKASKDYSPTFRSLISYFIRRGKDSFSKAFEHHRKQREWEKQVNNAFLLGLSWEDARDWQKLKDKKKALQDLQTAAGSGVFSEIIGSLGELEATKVRLENQIRTRENELQSYQVHPQYRELQSQANHLTREIHQMSNLNISDSNLLSSYIQSIEEEVSRTSDDILKIYEQIEIEIPEFIHRRFEEAQAFHSEIVENRRDFLSTELQRLRRIIQERERQIETLTQQRSEIMQTLETHGALEEYNRLQQLHLKNVEKLNEINSKIETLRKLEDKKLEYRIESDLLRQRAQRDYSERRGQREKAISIFNENSEALYSAPGSLVINIGDSGFKFDVEIERSDSEGVSNMKIFCYDLMLAQLWAEKDPGPNILIHDSTIFEGVDERQVALALELAAKKASQYGFQYICMLNSDRLPLEDFSADFDIYSHSQLTLTDETEDGSLLGLRF